MLTIIKCHLQLQYHMETGSRLYSYQYDNNNMVSLPFLIKNLYFFIAL